MNIRESFTVVSLAVIAGISLVFLPDKPGFWAPFLAAALVVSGLAKGDE